MQFLILYKKVLYSFSLIRLVVWMTREDNMVLLRSPFPCLPYAAPNEVNIAISFKLSIFGYR